MSRMWVGKGMDRLGVPVKCQNGDVVVTAEGRKLSRYELQNLIVEVCLGSGLLLPLFFKAMQAL